MGERRVPSVLSQTTLVEPAPGLPPEVPEPSSPNPDPEPLSPEASPRPVLYPAVVPSNVALRERQLRWLRERDRRAAATQDAPTKTEAEAPIVHPG